jgi:tartrate dehydratase beta subunit/fumarate hydratase class I family protein
MKITTPLSEDTIKKLKAGDIIYITGVIILVAIKHIKNWLKRLKKMV